MTRQQVEEEALAKFNQFDPRDKISIPETFVTGNINKFRDFFKKEIGRAYDAGQKALPPLKDTSVYSVGVDKLVKSNTYDLTNSPPKTP